MISENEKQKIEEIIHRFKDLTNLEIKYQFGKREKIIFSLPEINVFKNIQYIPRIEGKLADYLLTRLNRDNEVILTNYIPQKTALKFRENDIQYIDAAGNAFIHDTGLFFLIDGYKSDKSVQPEKIRVFQESGLKCLFYFFLNPDLLKQTQREVHLRTGLSLGTINYVFKDLKKLEYLRETGKGKWELVKRKKLLDRWLTGFEEVLRPKLLPRTYRLIAKKDYENWKNIPLDAPMNYWSGEAAGELLTNFLIPEKLTIYTRKERLELMQQLKILPFENGNIEVLNCFWNEELTNPNPINTAPPLLVYADLVISGDSRNYEVAQRIYEEHLSHFFEKY